MASKRTFLFLACLASFAAVVHSGWLLNRGNNNHDNNDEDDICMICRDSFHWYNSVVRTCDGTQKMHKECLARWLERHPECPHCRRIDEKSPDIDDARIQKTASVADAIVLNRIDMVEAWIRKIERTRGRNAIEGFVNQYVEQPNKRKKTLLQLAFQHDRLDIAVLLAQNGAYVSEQLVTPAPHRNNAYFFVISHELNRNEFEAPNTVFLEYLLTTRILVGLCNQLNETPLMFAIRSGAHPDIIRVLLRHPGTTFYPCNKNGLDIRQVVAKSPQRYRNEYLQILRNTPAYPSYQQRAQMLFSTLSFLFEAATEPVQNQLYRPILRRNL